MEKKLASQLEVGLRSVQLDLSYLRNNGFIKKVDTLCVDSFKEVLQDAF